MKRYIVLVILACVLFVSTGIAEGSEKSVLRNGITWGMSPEEVIEAEGQAFVEHYVDGENARYFFETEICDAKSTVVYIFKNNQLISFGFAIDDETVNEEAAFEYVVASLQHKYGEPRVFNASVLYYYLNKILCIPYEPINEPVIALYADATIIIPEYKKLGMVLYISEDSLYITDGL